MPGSVKRAAFHAFTGGCVPEFTAGRSRRPGSGGCPRARWGALELLRQPAAVVHRGDTGRRSVCMQRRVDVLEARGLLAPGENRSRCRASRSRSIVVDRRSCRSRYAPWSDLLEDLASVPRSGTGTRGQVAGKPTRRNSLLRHRPAVGQLEQRRHVREVVVEHARRPIEHPVAAVVDDADAADRWWRRSAGRRGCRRSRGSGRASAGSDAVAFQSSPPLNWYAS